MIVAYTSKIGSGEKVVRVPNGKKNNGQNNHMRVRLVRASSAAQWLVPLTAQTMKLVATVTRDGRGPLPCRKTTMKCAAAVNQKSGPRMAPVYECTRYSHQLALI
jgi:hypothetical protein